MAGILQMIIIKCIFMTENTNISIWIWLTFVDKCPMNDNLSLFHKMMSSQKGLQAIIWASVGIDLMVHTVFMRH